MKISILGTGNGGQAIAGYLAKQGYEVSIYGRNSDTISQLTKTKKIQLVGAIEGMGQLKEVTNDIHTSVRDAAIIMVVTTANAHASIASQIAIDLKDGQIIILNPGRTGGALEFKRALDSNGCKARVYVSEAQTLIYACRLVENGVVNIIGVKDKVLLSAVPSSDTDYILSRVQCF